MELPKEHVPVITPMPPLPPRDFINEAQWDTLLSLFDGALPSIVSASDVGTDSSDTEANQVVVPDDKFAQKLDRVVQSKSQPMTSEQVVAFLKHRPSQRPEFQDLCFRLLASSPQRARLVKTLDLLKTRLGSLLLTGYWNPVDQQPARVRQEIIQSWSTSRFLSLRLLAKSITALAQTSDAMTSPYLGSLAGYTDVPRNWTAAEGYDYNFIQVPPRPTGVEEPHIIFTDVVIVGSGCGGGVSAKNLAEAGHEVLVVDKGYYFPPSHLPMPQAPGTNHLFDNGSVYVTEDASTGIVCGGAWGGGGTVNWSVCLKLQNYVREEWADGDKLPFFTSKDFDESCSRVLDFMGAGTSGVRHNHRNKVLLEGSQKLGWRCAEAPRNTAGKEHYCGQCHLGCGSAEKRGPAVSWLPAAGDAGAQFMEGFHADKVLFANDGRTAVGIEGLWTSRDASGGVHSPMNERTQRKVVIKAKRVLMTAGSLWTPLILMRSGIKSNNLGQNLHIHPVNFVTGTYEEDTRPWEGGIITSYSPEFENIDEKGHGIKLEPTCMVPFTTLSIRPWTDGFSTKLQTLNYGHLASFISLARDRDTGNVFADKTTGRPRIAYSVSEHDADHVMEGVQALAKLCYVTGAREIYAHLPGIEPFVLDRDAAAKSSSAKGNKQSADPEFSDPAFAGWLARLRRVGNKSPAAIWSSAHQMGTCRMSASETQGVVDGQGKVWGKEGLYVADASVFPSASGVNPMATVMTVADWISRGVDQGLQGR